ncbi:MAG: hypothetical protein L6R36_004337 [Xanthoria steineri]|nr:MAG: hypothetical protein L6R36_004337 [Xanthoria steineri]
MSRFMYLSKTSNGTIVPVSAYILWPYIARDYGDGLPMVVWAHGTSGTNDECAPSNIQNLWHHFQAPYQLALLGYVVVATDYAGLGINKDLAGRFIVHEYLNGIAQAHDIAYSVPAAREAFPEISAHFVVIGSSEGGQAAWAFAEKLVSEPMDGHLGTIALSPVTRLLDLPDTAWRPTILNFDRDRFLPTKDSRAWTYVRLKGCNTILYNLAATGILREGWRDNHAVQEYQRAAEVGGKRISGPLLVIQGGADPIVYTPSVTDAVKRTVEVNRSASIQFHMLPNVSHAPAMYTGLHVYLDWIAARFFGQELQAGPSRSDPWPVRPASAQQIEANWFIQNQKAAWQAT